MIDIAGARLHLCELHSSSLSQLCHLRRLLRRLLRLHSPELLGRSVLLGPLGVADGADTGDGVLAKVATVVVLRGLVGDALVDPEVSTLAPDICIRPHSHQASLLAGRGVGAVGDGDDVLRGLVGFARVLGHGDDAAVVGGLDADGLVELERGFDWMLRVVYLLVGVPVILPSLASRLQTRPINSMPTL